MNGSEPSVLLIDGISAQVTGDERFHRSAIKVYSRRIALISAPIVRVCEFLGIPRVKVRIEKPVLGSQALLMQPIQGCTLRATEDCGALRPSLAFECLSRIYFGIAGQK